MLACPNCGRELDLSEMGEVCSSCGVLVPYDVDPRFEDEVGSGEDPYEEL